MCQYHEGKWRCWIWLIGTWRKNRWEKLIWRRGGTLTINKRTGVWGLGERDWQFTPKSSLGTFWHLSQFCLCHHWFVIPNLRQWLFLVWCVQKFRLRKKSYCSCSIGFWQEISAIGYNIVSLWVNVQRDGVITKMVCLCWQESALFYVMLPNCQSGSLIKDSCTTCLGHLFLVYWLNRHQEGDPHNKAWIL